MKDNQPRAERRAIDAICDLDILWEAMQALAAQGREARQKEFNTLANDKMEKAAALRRTVRRLRDIMED